MRELILSGILNLPWWGYVLVALGLTHATIASVTIYLHRHQAHRALMLHPLVSHVFRFWLWLTTGMITREWIAVHRKHHATTDKALDPHSPQILGIRRVLFGGVVRYMREADNAATIARYGHGAPNDWVERHVYSRCARAGVSLVGLADILMFGLLPGLAIFAVQLVWIPFFAAGVVNGAGHYWGYRNWHTNDSSTNIFPVGVLIGGEELHNNHHAFPTSARLSRKWYEFDVGWFYIRVLELLHLAHVRRISTRQ